MRLSILTPSFNYGAYIDDAVQSVAAQVPEAVEHVIFDGGSTDDTLKVLERAPAHVTWRSEPDKGPSDALNKALALATGDWIGWLSADDYYLPGTFEAVAQCLREHPDADVIQGDSLFVDGDGRILRLVAQHPFSSRVLRWERCNTSECALFMRRDALPARGWDVDLQVTMDWDSSLQVLSDGGRFVYLPRPLGAFRVHDGQLSGMPLPPPEHELELLRTRFGLPRRARHVARQAGRLEHKLLKVAYGGARRELRTRALLGADTRWFAGPEALANARAAVEAGSGRAQQPGVGRDPA